MRLITGIHKGQKLFCPKEVLRPTSEKLRACVFNICQFRIENASFLDLCAGIGAMGLEALSRQATNATFVDQSKISISFIEKNVANLKEESRATILQMEALRAVSYLEENNLSFDIIFVDPPYGKDSVFLSNQILKKIDASCLLKSGGDLFLEDDMDAEKEEIALKNLKFKSSRRFGRSLLRHFEQQ